MYHSTGKEWFGELLQGKEASSDACTTARAKNGSGSYFKVCPCPDQLKNRINVSVQRSLNEKCRPDEDARLWAMLLVLLEVWDRRRVTTAVRFFCVLLPFGRAEPADTIG